MLASFDWDVIQRSLPYLFREGMTFTVTLTVLAMFFGIILGTLLAMMRLSSFKPLAVAAGGYVNLMRSVPLVLVIFWFYFLVPYIGACIQSIPRGQVWAGYALGLNYWQTMGNVVLPQAFRNMMPVLLTQTIILFQDTSLVYVLSITDFLGAASKIAQRDGRLVEMYLFTAAIYFVISLGLSRFTKRLEALTAIVR